MTLAIDCPCGVHLEIDGRFAGQIINCPDCQQALQVPSFESPSVRTSGLALGSFLLALVGAFTVVGTILAVVLGALGLRSIARHPGRLRGNGYALAGIVLGVLFTALGLFAYSRVDILGLDRLLREPQWAGKLIYENTSEITEAGFTLPVLSRAWAKFHDAGEVLADSVILVNVRDDAHAIGFSFAKGPDIEDKAEAYRDSALARFLDSKLVRLLVRSRSGVEAPSPRIISTTKVAGPMGREPQDVVFDVPLGKNERTFVMRVIPAHDGLYVVAAGARKSRFAALEKDLRQIISGFRVSERPNKF